MPIFRVHHLVVSELNEARTWYADRSPWAAASFSRLFDLALGRVASRPRSCPPWRSIFRRAGISRFPYRLLFHVDSRRTSVLALVHSRREPVGILRTLNNRFAQMR
jgi:hypothetical protein